MSAGVRCPGIGYKRRCLWSWSMYALEFIFHAYQFKSLFTNLKSMLTSVKCLLNSLNSTLPLISLPTGDLSRKWFHVHNRHTQPVIGACIIWYRQNVEEEIPFLSFIFLCNEIQDIFRETPLIPQWRYPNTAALLSCSRLTCQKNRRVSL